jgi:hypothetical protein
MVRKWPPFQLCFSGVHGIFCWNKKLAPNSNSCLDAQTWNRIGDRQGGQKEVDLDASSPTAVVPVSPTTVVPLPSLLPYRPGRGHYPPSFPARRSPTGQGEATACRPTPTSQGEATARRPAVPLPTAVVLGLGESLRTTGAGEGDTNGERRAQMSGLPEPETLPPGTSASLAGGGGRVLDSLASSDALRVDEGVHAR